MSKHTKLEVFSSSFSVLCCHYLFSPFLLKLLIQPYIEVGTIGLRHFIISKHWIYQIWPGVKLSLFFNNSDHFTFQEKKWKHSQLSNGVLLCAFLQSLCLAFKNPLLARTFPIILNGPYVLLFFSVISDCIGDIFNLKIRRKSSLDITPFVCLASRILSGLAKQIYWQFWWFGDSAAKLVWKWNRFESEKKFDRKLDSAVKSILRQTRFGDGLISAANSIQLRTWFSCELDSVANLILRQT